MKVLFIARHFTYFRNYDSIVERLARRGHEVHLAAEKEEELGGRDMVARLAEAHPGISFGWLPERSDRWARVAAQLRMTIDYLRYLEPAYDTMPRLRARARERVPRIGLWLVSIAAARTATGRRMLGAVLRACERAIPRSAGIDGYLRAQDPDVVLFTPLIGLVVSPQLDYLQSAKALGYPTALCVWSWDHLSSKAIVRNVPDRVFVWNDTQRNEAVTLHGVAPDRIVVTGAQCFDQWFDRQPRATRSDFCRKVGLADDRPFLLYVCSALFRGGTTEAEFVQRWIAAVRSSGLEPLASTPILVRPHPARMKEWSGVELTERDVAFWGRNPIDADARADYFDSLHYSAAVAGLNTSAFLEGAVAGRPIFATLLPEHHENQEGTIHFHYLLTVGGGLLHTARTLDAHLAQLNASLRQPHQDSARSRHFVQAFIRPYGRDVAATPLMLDAIEVLARQPRRDPASESVGVRLLRAALMPLGVALATAAAEPLMCSERERVIAARDRAMRARREETWREKHAKEEAEQREKAARTAARQRHKAQVAAEWRRSKMTKKWTRRIRRRIGLGQ
jgi:hypothetical protein